MKRYSDTWTERKLEALERRIVKEYGQAQKDLDEKARVYFKKLKTRYIKEYQAYQNGAYTKEQFQAWYRSQIGRGRRWEALRDDMARRLTHANEFAAKYTNKAMPDIFSQNYNYEAYLIEREFPNISFTLMDENTIKNLMTSNREILPMMRVDIAYDLEWNVGKLENALLQGILQGDGIEEIAKRFQNVTNMNESSAIRNARTAVTGAQNSGRWQNFKDAEEMGVELEKEWMSTLDSRTRESHRQMDGVRVGNDEPFPNGLMYPCDMRGDPAEIYNCRCTMVASIKENKRRNIERIMRNEDGRWELNSGYTYTGVGGTKSYAEWIRGKKNAN